MERLFEDMLILSEGVTVLTSGYNNIHLNNNAILIVPPDHTTYFEAVLWENSKIYILNPIGKSKITAYMNAFVYSLGNSKIEIYQRATALAYNSIVFAGRSTFALVRNCKCFANDNAHIHAFNNSEVYAVGKPTLHLYDTIYLHAFNSPKIEDNRIKPLSRKHRNINPALLTAILENLYFNHNFNVIKYYTVIYNLLILVSYDHKSSVGLRFKNKKIANKAADMYRLKRTDAEFSPKYIYDLTNYNE